MKSTATNTSTELALIPKTENQKGIENHKKAAAYFEEAAKSHKEAAKYYKNEEPEKASKSSIKAHNYSSLANGSQQADVKQHSAIIV